MYAYIKHLVLYIQLGHHDLNKKLYAQICKKRILNF